MFFVENLAKHLFSQGKIKIFVDEQGSKRVRFTDPIYKNSPFLLPLWYSTEFSDQEILEDWSLSHKLGKMTGLEINRFWA